MHEHVEHKTKQAGTHQRLEQTASTASATEPRMGRQADKARCVAEDCVLEKNSSEHPPGVSMIWTFFPQSSSVPSQVFSADVSAIGRKPIYTWVL
jgi:hypothetical protein